MMSHSARRRAPSANTASCVLPGPGRAHAQGSPCLFARPQWHIAWTLDHHPTRPRMRSKVMSAAHHHQACAVRIVRGCAAARCTPIAGTQGRCGPHTQATRRLTHAGATLPAPQDGGCAYMTPPGECGEHAPTTTRNGAASGPCAAAHLRTHPTPAVRRNACACVCVCARRAAHTTRCRCHRASRNHWRP